MLIHFAFSKLKDDAKTQIEKFINTILTQRQLLFGINPEFIPVFPASLHNRFKGQFIANIPLEAFTLDRKGAAANLIEIPIMRPEEIMRIHYLDENVMMICFIQITQEELPTSPHLNIYGKLGIVLNEDFLNTKGISRVYYYEEDELFKDPLVCEWNEKFAYRPNLSTKEREEDHRLRNKILAFRKPACLFKSFKESRRLKIGAGLEIEDAYGRYEEGYNFKNENEFRIVYSDRPPNSEVFLKFEEKDVEMVIVPDLQSKDSVEAFFCRRWKTRPETRVFPI